MSTNMGIPQRKQARLLASRGWPTLAIVRRLLDENEDLHPLTAWRWANGWSLADVEQRARELFPYGPHLDASTILCAEQWLDGRRVRGRGPTLERLAQFARLYGCAVTDFLDGWHDHLHPQERQRADQHYAEFVNRRDFLSVVGAAITTPAVSAMSPPPTGMTPSLSGPVTADWMDLPARIVSSDVTALTDKLDDLYVACHQTGGHAYGLFQSALAVVQGLLAHADYNEVVGRELYGLAATIRRDLAYCAYDAGRPDLARATYVEAINEATIAADPTVVVYARLGLAQLETDYGDPRRAIAQLEAARAEARPVATGRLVALLDRWVGCAHARLGDRGASEHAGLAAERRYEPYQPGRDPAFLFEWWNPSALKAGQAQSWIALGEYDRAERAASQALAGVDRDRFPRNHASYSSFRAVALTGAGRYDQAGAAITDTVTGLDGIQAARVLDRFRPLVPVLSVHEADPHVAGALHALRVAGVQ